MTAPIWTRNEIESPCTQICVIHPTAKICAGCYRTLEEIGGWSAMTSDQRAEIMAELPERSHLIRKRRGGRVGRKRPTE